jgi:hypothetical protein
VKGPRIATVLVVLAGAKPLLAQPADTRLARDAATSERRMTADIEAGRPLVAHVIVTLPGSQAPRRR